MPIRAGKEQDAGRIAEIIVFSKRLAYLPIFQDEHYLFHVLTTAVLDPVILQQMDTWVVFDDGTIKGAMRLQGRKQVVELLELYVDPCFQSQGIGTALVKWLIERYPRKDILLWVIANNVRAKAFYERFGFMPTGQMRLIEGTKEMEICMCRKGQYFLGNSDGRCRSA